MRRCDSLRQTPVMSVVRIDQLNLGLVFLACLIAHAVPLEMLVLSYAILGPAHYLTEISWLHDRQYFTKQKFDYLPICVLGFIGLASQDERIFYHCLIACFWLAICMAFIRNWLARLAVTTVAGAISIVLAVETPAVWFFILLSSLIHILVFTAIFILLGALRNDSLFGYATLGALVLCGATFFIPGQPWLATTQLGLDTIHHLDAAYEAFFELIGVAQGAPNTERLIGFIAFAYTYHYLNWFSKTGVIGWHRISPQRTAVIATAYLACIGLYAYDYQLGFKAVLFLSFGHVILEFPLNGLSIAQTGKLLAAKVRPAAT